MLQCLFYGTGQAAAEHQDGVCIEVQMAGYRVLLDCGLSDLSVISHQPPPDVVICSHAHVDHIRSLDPFHQIFPTVPLYSSDVTAVLSNCAAVQTLPWRSAIEILPGLTVQLFPAGHLPGAALILLTELNVLRNQTLLYTGDLSLTNSRLTEGLKLEELRGLAPDVLILEGTYGIDRHPHRRQLETRLMEQLDQVLLENQSIVIPLSPLGLAQEILILLRSHHLFSGRSVQIWVDETIASVCQQYEQLIPTFPNSIQNFARYQPLFLDQIIRPWIQTFQDSERLISQIQDSGEPQIVLISEVEFDRLDLESRIQENTWQILRSILLPDHCDGSTLPQVIHNLRPQHVAFVHGTVEKLMQLAELEELNSRYKLHIPAAGTELELPIADQFNHPTLPEVTYEGEWIETEAEILLSVPSEITADPRWKKLSNLGLVSVQWQGETLVIRSMTQRSS